MSGNQGCPPTPSNAEFVSIAPQEASGSSISPTPTLPLRPVACFDVPLPPSLAEALTNLHLNSQVTAQATAELGNVVQRLQQGVGAQIQGLQEGMSRVCQELRTWTSGQAANVEVANTTTAGEIGGLRDLLQRGMQESAPTRRICRRSSR